MNVPESMLTMVDGDGETIPCGQCEVVETANHRYWFHCVKLFNVFDLMKTHRDGEVFELLVMNPQTQEIYSGAAYASPCARRYGCDDEPALAALADFIESKE